MMRQKVVQQAACKLQTKIEKKAISTILISRKKQLKNYKVKFRFKVDRNERIHVVVVLERNVEFLFPVQAESYQQISEKKDCLVQAYTGTGKTLAFAIPIVELLQNDSTVKLTRGRAPRALALAPTRELSTRERKNSTSI